MSTLIFRNIHKSFRQTIALNSFSLTVNAGEICGFLGRNGAGKSTALRIGAGVIDPDSGQVEIERSDEVSESPVRIGFMPEERGLYSRERVSEQLEFFGRLGGLSKRDSKRETSLLLERLDLQGKEHEILQNLSLGNQQRVQLAAALVHRPEILLLDEPFSGLDPLASMLMRDLLFERASNGVSVLFSSHQIDMVENCCDSVAFLKDGHIVRHSTISDLQNSQIDRVEISRPQNCWPEFNLKVIQESDSWFAILNSSSYNPIFFANAVQNGEIDWFRPAKVSLSEIYEKELG